MAENLVMYAVLGAIIGIVYGLRRIYVLERKIDNIDRKIMGAVRKKR